VILWRVSNHTSLDGSGGLRASGRWHTRGQRVIYCAPNPATALLEVLVHAEIDVEDMPVNFRYLEIEVPDSLAVEAVDTKSLGPAWQKNLEATRQAGDEWLRSRRTPLFRIPSVLVPVTWNVLIHPQHPDAANIRVANIHNHGIDVLQADAKPRRFQPQIVLASILLAPGPAQCVSSDSHPPYPSASRAAICPFQSTARVPRGPQIGLWPSIWQSFA
jgi:RES domain-containing protein